MKTAAPWQSAAEFNDYCVEDMGITYDEFKKRGYIAEPFSYKKYKGKGFKHPPRKVELYSSIFARFGYDPIPYCQENPETPRGAEILMLPFTAETAESRPPTREWIPRVTWPRRGV